MKWSISCLWIAVLVLCSSQPAAAEAPTAPAAITIDAAKTREPMSKYVYGQFIEHLGRCIYGGIWAEMLEDRKFYYGVGAKESPWKATAGEACVVMDKHEPFVGEHTPVLKAPTALVQGDLALRRGKRYVGRIWLAGDATAAPVKVSLAWGDEPGDRQVLSINTLTAEYTKTPLEFVARADTDQGRLEILADGKGNVRVGTVSLMPAYNVHGMRPDTLALLKKLNSPVYRWPGGNFVSGYNWRDGLGDPDRRPPRKNPAWKGVEPNDFGMDEFILFCREIVTEPYIAVNSGLGDAASAAAEVEYANGAATTPEGARRAKNGHAEPYRVKFWGVGNEMYGNWQLGHMPLEQYAAKHNEFAKAMWAVDPSIQLIGVGDKGPWSISMLKNCASSMNLISEHFYCNEKKDLAAHVRQIPDQVRAKAEAHRAYRKEIDSLKGKDIRIALDEWNYWYGPHVFGELGTRYFLKDALGIAAGLNEYSRQTDIIFMANYAQTVNVIGAIKTSKTAACLDTTGLVLMLYRQQFGTLPVEAKAAAPLDVAAAWTADHKTLTIAIVNPTLEKIDLPLNVNGAKLKASGRRWQIAGSDPMAYNDPSLPDNVKIEKSTVDTAATISVAPCSVTLYAFPRE
jgi:alpha-N-arabinofuranosidase